MTITPEMLIRREVYMCVSHLVATLANSASGLGLLSGQDRRELCADLSELCEQAMELCTPIDDWEEAAIQEGWRERPTAGFPRETQFQDGQDGMRWACDGWQQLCEDHDIEPYQREIFEHWAVSDWLANELEQRGERVERDFAGMTVWGRTCSGQGIASDGVIQEICAAINARVAAAD